MVGATFHRAVSAITCALSCHRSLFQIKMVALRVIFRAWRVASEDAGARRALANAAAHEVWFKDALCVWLLWRGHVEASRLRRMEASQQTLRTLLFWLVRFRLLHRIRTAFLCWYRLAGYGSPRLGDPRGCWRV
jgi:hypothetical protein